MACVQFTNVCFTAGDTVNLDFQYLEDDGVTPIDLTGATAQMQLLNDITDVSQVDDLNGGNGNSVTDLLMQGKLSNSVTELGKNAQAIANPEIPAENAIDFATQWLHRFKGRLLH